MYKPCEVLKPANVTSLPALPISIFCVKELILSGPIVKLPILSVCDIDKSCPPALELLMCGTVKSLESWNGNTYLTIDRTYV